MENDATNRSGRLARRCIRLAVPLLLSLGAGCFSRLGSANSSNNPQPAHGQRAPGASTPARQMEYEPVLRPGLAINVRVDVAGRTEVDEKGKLLGNDGTISLPFLREVTLARMTLREAAVFLTQQYRRFFVDPLVVVEFAAQQPGNAISPWGHVTVLGRVRKPGQIPFPSTGDMTVSGAVQQAGGFDTSARDTSVRVNRQSAAGNLQVFEVNLRAVGASGQVADDILLLPGDVVYVGERRL